MTRVRENFIRPQSTPEAVVAVIRSRIAAGELRPGDQLRPMKIAKELGVSHIPVREALRILEGEALVVSVPHRGIFIAELSLSDLREVYRMTELLETEAIGSAMANLDADKIEELESYLQAAEAANESGDMAAYVAANRQFHLQLFATSGQPLLVRIIEQLWNSSDAYRVLCAELPDYRAAANADHRLLMSAIAARDREAIIAAQDRHRERILRVFEVLFSSDSDPGRRPEPELA